MHRYVLPLLLLGALLPASGNSTAAEPRHVVVVVWDGMRPDLITPEHAPTLCQLASNGVFFANHHSIYCTATDVNGTAIATGAYPAHSGIIANNDYLPAIQSNKPVVVALPEVMAKGDEATSGKFIARPTVAEILKAAGKTTAIAGSKHVALMHDRRERDNAAESVCVHEGEAMPAAALPRITRELGAFPGKVDNEPNAKRDEWTRRTLTEVLWSNGVPAYSLLWLSEPDASQHATKPGSPRSMAAIESSDRQLAAVLAELEKRNLRDKTDVFVVSDHGFSSITERIDIVAALKEGGFHAHREFKSASKNGDIMVASQGGSDLFYVIGHEKKTIHRLVEFLQQQKFTGVIFSEKKLPGTFPLTSVHLDRTSPPDVVISLRWSEDKNTYGIPGSYYCDGGSTAGGAHASLSRFDIHNTLVAAGPDIRPGWRDESPSANTDLAPTILSLLGVKPSVPMDGRILKEAFISDGQSPQPVTERLEAAKTNGSTVWRQYLQTTKLDNTVYIDEGNGVETKQP